MHVHVHVHVCLHGVKLSALALTFIHVLLYMCKKTRLLSCSAKKNSIFDNEEETRSDVDLFLLSQDIDSAIERFLPSSSPRNAHSSIPNGAHLPREEFLPAKLHDWDLTMCSENSELSCTCTCMSIRRL